MKRTDTQTLICRPILFNGEMVRAILDGRKTQTRRIVKPQVLGTAAWSWLEQCPFGAVGDRLWVRETWAPNEGDALAGKVHYRADGSAVDRWKPSIHMPRWASRITLEITGVRVERLQDISNSDCVAEGIEAVGDEVNTGGVMLQVGRLNGRMSTVRQLYSELWQSAYGPGSWLANPWVWVVEFRRVER